MSAWLGHLRHGLAIRMRPVSPYLLDTAVAAAVAVPTAVPFVAAAPGQITPLGALLTVGTVLPLVWRRRWPFAIAVIVSLFALAVSLYHEPGQGLQYGVRGRCTRSRISGGRGSAEASRPACSPRSSSRAGG